jgi:hypothetical protein
MEFDRVSVGERLFVGKGKPEILGRGPLAINGSAYIESPTLIGNANTFPNVWATCMIGPLTNPESPPPIIPGVLQACIPTNNSPYSLAVIGDAAIFDNLDVNLTINAGVAVRAGALIISQGEVMSRCGTHILSAKKNFDIPHPIKEGWRLRHTCPEGPSNDVYFRGKLLNEDRISLPDYWKKFVDVETITVQLQPIGAHQDIVVKRVDESFVYLQSNGAIPIQCYYHVYATRKDGDTLIPEYPGLTPDDYPGDNREYNINK